MIHFIQYISNILYWAYDRPILNLLLTHPILYLFSTAYQSFLFLHVWHEFIDHACSIVPIIDPFYPSSSSCLLLLTILSPPYYVTLQLGVMLCCNTTTHPILHHKTGSDALLTIRPILSCTTKVELCIFVTLFKRLKH